MAKVAVIKINSAQYIVEEGKTYEVPKFSAEVGSRFEVPEVLALDIDGKYEVGTPLLNDRKVVLEILEQSKGEKVIQRIYKAKSRYRRIRGHRKQVTKFRVVSIA
ncbi:50S ribosomal protein L21 [Candidatus Dojkabacteria bacterium]|uniref:Large ribosomal subunit protein bL21 n=1 Tax=Candidatus Dojkabacteria bacterium TaxID=2099670 RepID=A0A3M0YX70_9BACT|nr:MAG: 50S ribosomal protein L21 [Candidatus Dojkabacteria bacterium]